MMKKYMLGEKMRMSQVFDKEGNAIPVTLIRVRPNTVLQIRDAERDGYVAIQLGYGVQKAHRVRKPQKGHFKTLGMFRYVKEFRVCEDSEQRTLPKVGDIIDASMIQEGDRLKISGISKSKGFQGVVKRHGFHGAPASHGTKHAHRQPGSIGAVWPQRVIKGMRMAGRMGGQRVSVRNVIAIEVDAAEQIIAIKGAVPGKPGTLVEIRG